MKVWTDAGDMHIRDSSRAVPARLPFGERDDEVVSPIAGHVGRRRTRERLSGMDERRLDEGGARVSRGALERTDPFARDRVHQIRASERASQIARVDQRGWQQNIDGGAEPTAPRWDEDESRSVRPDRDRSWRRRQHFAGHPRAMPRWTQP